MHMPEHLVRKQASFSSLFFRQWQIKQPHASWECPTAPPRHALRHSKSTLVRMRNEALEAVVLRMIEQLEIIADSFEQLAQYHTQIEASDKDKNVLYADVYEAAI